MGRKKRKHPSLLEIENLEHANTCPNKEKLRLTISECRTSNANDSSKRDTEIKYNELTIPKNNNQYDDQTVTRGNYYSNIISLATSKSDRQDILPSSWLRKIYILKDNTNDSYYSSCIGRKNEQFNNNEAIESISQQDIESIQTLQTKLNHIKESFEQACNNVVEMRRHTDSSDMLSFNTTESVFYHARNLSNPMEGISNLSIHTTGQNRNNQIKRNKRSRYGANSFRFTCRSGWKLANIDAILNFELVQGCKCINMKPKMLGESQPSASSDAQSKQSEIYYFVDLCGAPGGFSEYIFHRRHFAPTKYNSSMKMVNNSCKNHGQSEDFISTTHHITRGFGMSLKGKNEHGTGLKWKINQNKLIHQLIHNSKKNPDSTASNTTFDSILSVFQESYGIDGTGDIYNWENILSLQEQIRQDQYNIINHSTNDTTPGSNESHPKGGLVNLVVADGGFDAQRDSECQESLASKIVISQTAAAFILLKCGGNYIVKMFGFQTPTSRKLMMYLCKYFGKVVLIKPITSRPASAERYVVCLDYIGDDFMIPKVVLEWRDMMMSLCDTQDEKESLGQDHLLNTKHTDYEENTFMTCLEDMDRDMLILNIEACKQILFNIQNKSIFSLEDDNSSENFEQYTGCTGLVDLSKYKLLWDLN